MSEVKNTPAPWKLLDQGIGDISVVDANNGGTICHINNKGSWFPAGNDGIKGRSQKTMISHGILIAAAPEMLSALRGAVCALAFAAERDPTFHAQYQQVSDAIDLANGVQQ